MVTVLFLAARAKRLTTTFSSSDSVLANDRMRFMTLLSASTRVFALGCSISVLTRKVVVRLSDRTAAELEPLNPFAGLLSRT